LETFQKFKSNAKGIAIAPLCGACKSKLDPFAIGPQNGAFNSLF